MNVPKVQSIILMLSPITYFHVCESKNTALGLGHRFILTLFYMHVVYGTDMHVCMKSAYIYYDICSIMVAKPSLQHLSALK